MLTPVETVLMAIAAEADAAMRSLSEKADRAANVAAGGELVAMRELLAAQRAFVAKRVLWGKTTATLLRDLPDDDPTEQMLRGLVAAALANADRMQAELFARSASIAGALNARVQDRTKRHAKVAKRIDALRERLKALRARSPGQARREAVTRGKEIIGLVAELDAIAALGQSVERSRKLLDSLRRGFELFIDEP